MIDTSPAGVFGVAFVVSVACTVVAYVLALVAVAYEYVGMVRSLRDAEHLPEYVEPASTWWVVRRFPGHIRQATDWRATAHMATFVYIFTFAGSVLAQVLLVGVLTILS